jgi:hypothetical protein
VLLLGGRGIDGAAAVAGRSPKGIGPTVTLAFGGDVLLGDDMNTYVARRGAEAPLAGVPELREADLAMVNLESVVAPGADAVDSGRVGDYYFLGRPETLEVLEAAGIDLVSTANNHARDFGTAALAAEDRLLAGMAMAHPGTGRVPAAACAPVYLAPRGLRIAVFSINTTEPTFATGDGEIGTCYLAPRDREGWERIFRPAFADARLKANVILAMPHFRASFSTVPDPADRAVAQLLIDLGADAVLGDGAHALQGIEVHDGRPILHNAGSLLFNFPEPDEAAIFILSLSSAGVEGIRTVPLITEHDWTRPASPAEATGILAAIDARSRALGTGVSGGSLELAPQPRDPPTIQPENLARLNPGPAPGPAAEPPAVCTVAAVPEGAAVTPAAVGPLTLVGARAERDRIDGPALIWLETFWRIDARTRSDLSIAPRALPQRGTPWQGVHEPCDWAWPTSRWEPGVLYRDRYPLRPPPEVQRLGGIPALVSGTGYGPLTISVEVLDQGRTLGESGVLRTVVLDPAVATRFGIAAGATTAGVLIVAFIGWRRRRVSRTG